MDAPLPICSVDFTNPPVERPEPRWKEKSPEEFARVCGKLPGRSFPPIMTGSNVKDEPGLETQADGRF
jgi:hypothetical protein